ncbi:testis-expressed protein 9-like [Gigantopelta aegis]|uniref:testis-expressed protein 9-like n=1 Tax=Gigantopelta aegis TaxID=1735272 RepID=UPI001B888E33|nr:testis-expressed protein 9-like [Gigantopelta aegis]
MAEMSSKENSTRASRPSSGRRSASGTKNNNVTKTSDIYSKEEEYKRLNEELEVKTANLVREAEEVMRDQESVLSKSRLLDNINTDTFLKEFDDDLTGPNEAMPRRPISHPSSKVSNQIRPGSRSKKPGLPRTRPKSRSKSNLADDVATLDETFMTEFREMSMAEAISHIEGNVDDDSLVNVDDDIIPAAAADMGTEATIRFLKAKLRVMQEELDRLTQECHKKDEESNRLATRLKDLEEERGRLVRTGASQQTQIDKYKKMAEDAKNKSESAETQLAGLRKELEQIKRTQKQQTSTQSATEVRLNRALEEIEKYKEQLLKFKSSSKDTSEQEKKRLEQLLLANRRLEKQKNELMTGFKKQLKLIDILKRQKMHVEAAKMLQFSEEEFVKALEWGS